MRIALILLPLIFSCGNPPCRTSCGITSEVGICADLVGQEWKALQSFEGLVAHWDSSWTCPRLEGFEVVIDPNSDGHSFNKDGENLLGYTDCAAKKIVTANEEWKRNAFTHELGHVIEACLGPPVVPVWHYGWEGRGINAAINNVTLDTLDGITP